MSGVVDGGADLNRGARATGSRKWGPSRRVGRPFFEMILMATRELLVVQTGPGIGLHFIQDNQ